MSLNRINSHHQNSQLLLDQSWARKKRIFCSFPGSLIMSSRRGPYKHSKSKKNRIANGPLITGVQIQSQIYPRTFKKNFGDPWPFYALLNEILTFIKKLLNSFNIVINDESLSLWRCLTNLLEKSAMIH